MSSSTTAFPIDQLDLVPGRFGGIIFDCDGTLADTMPLHYQAWLHALASFGASFEFDWELFVSRAGMSLERTVEALNLQFDGSLNPEQVAQAQRTWYDAGLKDVQPIRDVVALAKRAAVDHVISVASGSQYHHVVRTLELIGVRSYFDVIVTPADVEHGKPAPDMFLLAAQRMGIEPDKCLVVEDSEFGVVAARRAGMQVAIVPTRRPKACAISSTGAL